MRIRHPYLALLAMVLLASCAPRTASGPVIYVPVPTYTPTPDTPSTGSPSASPGAPVELTITMPHPPITLDPARVALMDETGRDLIENLLIGLTYLNPDTGRVEPWLAESGEASEDGLVWLFHLREGVWWARRDAETQAIIDERQVIAHDVVYAIQRACELGVNMPATHPLFVIQGCREAALAAGGDTAESPLGVNALDDYTVEVRLTEPASYLPTLFAMPVTRPVPWENVDEGWPLPEALWASGPWMVESASDTSITLIRNPFWVADETAAHLDRLTMLYGGGESGETQTLLDPQATFAVFSLGAAPLDNVHVRRALALATDRADFTDWGVPLTTFAPPGTALAPENAPLSPDEAAARRELAEAGYEGCDQMWAITILTDESAASGAMAEQLAATWAETLDCPDSAFEVEQLSLEQVMTMARHMPLPPHPQIILFSWEGDYADAHHWLADIFGCRETFSRAFLDQGRACSSGDDLLAQAASEPDPETRAALYAQIHDAWFAPVGEVIAIPLIASAHSFSAPSGVTIRPTLAGPMRFDLWEVGTGAD
jgi:oligopeptide transport system substrate-binding protein